MGVNCFGNELATPTGGESKLAAFFMWSEILLRNIRKPRKLASTIAFKVVVVSINKRLA